MVNFTLEGLLSKCKERKGILVEKNLWIWFIIKTMRVSWMMSVPSASLVACDLYKFVSYCIL